MCTFLLSVVPLSVCGSLDDVSVDGQCDGSRAVHSSQRFVRLLAVHSSCHSAVVLDATGEDGHHDQNPRVDAYGDFFVVVGIVASDTTYLFLYIINMFSNVDLGCLL